MAGDWMALRLDLHDDPAVIAISTSLQMEPDLVVGKLTKLWAWANRQLKDGVAKGITQDWVDRYLSAAGFAAAMADAEWLQIRSGSIHFPKFDTWNSASAKKRLIDSKRKAVKRVSDVCPQNVRDLSALETDKNGTKGKESKGKEREGPLPAGIGEEPQTRKQKAALLAQAYRFLVPGLRKPMTEELEPQFEEKLRVYGDDKFCFILGKINGERDKTLPIFRFWKTCGMDDDSGIVAQATRPGKSAEQIKFEQDLAELERQKGQPDAD